MPMTDWPVHGRIDGPIVMIGFGSIGRGTLPLIERHFTFDRDRLVVVDPNPEHRDILDRHGVRLVEQAVTRDKYRSLLTPLLTAGDGQGFCVNLSVEVESLAVPVALLAVLGPWLLRRAVPRPVQNPDDIERALPGMPRLPNPRS